MIKRVKMTEFYEKGLPTQPFVLDVKMTDITNTIVAAVHNLDPLCVGVSRGWLGEKHKQEVEQAAEKKGVRIFWVKGPYSS